MFLGVSSQAWFPVITLVVGAVLKGVFDLLTEKRAERRERMARQEQRRETLRLKRSEFQHATLLEFQEVVAKLVRHVGRANFLDTKHFRETGNWRGMILGDDLNQGILIEQQNFGRLRVRIRDDAARDIAGKFSSAAVAALMAPNELEANAAMATMANYLEALSERIGELLRDLEIDEEKMLVDGR